MERLLTGAAALGIRLDRGQVERFRAYHEALVHWNRRVNLTSIVDEDRVQSHHFLDSLTAASALPRPILQHGRIVDVGSGAGFPGVPLKIAFPGLSLALVESTGKKAEFLERLVGLLGLYGVEVLAGRAETLGREPRLRERFDAVLARALGPLPVVAELTLPFARLGGALIAQRRGDLAREVEDAAPALRALGGGAADVRFVDLPDLADGRALVVVAKVAPTPERYPRRPGAPSKRPIGGHGSAAGRASGTDGLV